jgi:Ca2+-binding EF-hand superfamily protein
LSEIIAEVDKDGSGSIEFEEFASMLTKITNSKKKVIPREFLKAHEISDCKEAFKFFCNEAEVISGSDLDRLFRKMGFNLKKEQVDTLLKEFDEDGSGQIEFSEFCVMMIKLRKQKRFRRISKSVATATALCELVQEGLTAEELRELDYSVSELRSWFKIAELLQAGFDINELIEGGVAIQELRDAGMGVLGLRKAGVSSLVLRRAGFSAEAIRKANRAVAVEKWDLENVSDEVAMVGGKTTGISAREARLRELTKVNEAPLRSID